MLSIQNPRATTSGRLFVDGQSSVSPRPRAFPPTTGALSVVRHKASETSKADQEASVNQSNLLRLLADSSLSTRLRDGEDRIETSRIRVKRREWLMEGSGSYLDRRTINDRSALREDLLLESKTRTEAVSSRVSQHEGRKGRRRARLNATNARAKANEMTN